MWRTLSTKQAKTLGERLGVDFHFIDLQEFRKGLLAELSQLKLNERRQLADEALQRAGKVVWAHLQLLADYYTRFPKLETKRPQLKRHYELLRN